MSEIKNDLMKKMRDEFKSGICRIWLGGEMLNDGGVGKRGVMFKDI